MAESVFKRTFDMNEYVQKRMLEIHNLEERVLYKEVAERMLTELEAWNKATLDQMEKRIFSEVEQAEHDFFLTTGIIDRQHYDATDSFLHPIFPDDITDNTVSIQELLGALNNGEDFRLYSIFLQASYSTIQAFSATEDRRYQGVVKTSKGEYGATFRINMNKKYLDKFMMLYQSFIDNDVPWNTICAAYLHKMFDVYLCSIESSEQLGEITEIVVDFEEYSSFVRYHMIPLWNLKLIEEKSSTYPIPCEDKINYEHRIYAHRLKPNCGYLVISDDINVSHVSRVNGDIIIAAPKSEPHLWTLYQCNKSQWKTSYSYPLLSNERDKNFTNALNNMFHKQLRTKSGIEALINSLPYTDYLTFKGLEISDKISENLSTYDMDDFLTAEINTETRHQILKLYFEPNDKGNFLNDDIMSFLVTQVQASIPDYHCVGQLV